MKVKVDKKRLRELEQTEAKMRALEGAGVDNWEGYDIAMEVIEKENEKFTLVENTVEGILEEASSHIETNLAGPGTGHGFYEEAYDTVHELLEIFIEEYNKI